MFTTHTNGQSPAAQRSFFSVFIGLLFFGYSLRLTAQITEDFETGVATGWVTSGTASTGHFVVGSPTGQVSSGVQTQLAGDHTPGAGVNAYFTGVNVSAGNQDVDNGTAISTSPLYVVGADAQLSLWYFFGQRDTGDDAGDFFHIEYSLDNGVQFNTLVFLGDTAIDAVWTEVKVFIPGGSDVVLRVTVSDMAGNGDIIEGGIDDLLITTLPDNDQDGVANMVDLDDDNDGILDRVECGGLSVPFINGDFELPVTGRRWAYLNENLVPGWETTATDGLIEVWDSSISGIPSQDGNQFVELNATQTATLFQSFSLNGLGGQVTWSVYHRGRAGVETANVLFGENLAVATVEATMVDGNTGWGFYSGTFTIPPGQTSLVIAFESVVGGSIGNFLDDVVVNINEGCQDTDGDGDPDNWDLDSDGDHCSDVREAGFADPNDDGILGATLVAINANGQVSGTIDGYTPPLDGDGNTVYDFLENTGIPVISTQPVNTATCPGCTTSLSVAATAYSYQWQKFNGTLWENLTDGGIYSNTNTNVLNITNPTVQNNQDQYRVVLLGANYACELYSNPADLTIRVTTVITNRRISYRVNRG